MLWIVYVCNYKKKIKLNYVIFETYNIIYKKFKNLWKISKLCKCHNINLYTRMFQFYNFDQVLLWVVNFNLIFYVIFKSLNVIQYKVLKKSKLYDQILW